MPVPSSLDDLSTTPALNYPAGSESPSTADDYFRAHAALLKQVDNKAAGLRADLAVDAPGKGASLVGYDGGTVQDVLDSAKPMQNYTALRNYTGRATAVRITTPGIAGFFQRDADTTTADNGGTVIVDASGRRWKRVFDGAVKVDWFSGQSESIQAAIDAGFSRVEMGKGQYNFSSITIKPSLRELVGSGATNTDTYLKRKAGATGAAIAWDGANRVTQAFVGHFRMDGNGEAEETYGLDLSGFSYCTFQNIWARVFRLDGVYADGSLTPTNKQFSNNTFINVRSNNNLRDGWRFEGSSQANSANTYIGCEGAGNAGRGFNELVGYANQTVGCTFQGNTGRDFYTNGSRNKHEFYAEGNPRPVEIGPESFGNNFSVRSSYPLWNTFLDAGVQNTVSVRGESEPERHIFNNPFFLNWNGITPAGVTLSGTPALASYTDSHSPAGAGVQATVGANFQGFIFTLNEPSANLQGKWVTLILEIDTAGVAETLQTRVYTRDGTTLNGAVGEFAVEGLPQSASGQFLRLAYDVKFPAAIAGAATVIWYMAYSGNSAGGNIIKIRSARIVMGQTRNASQPAGMETQHASNTATLSVAANAINTHRKYLGRVVYETNSGKMRYAISDSPTSAWRAFDGTGDITPA